MLLVITITVPLTVPKLFDYQIYAVLTGSMTPAYSVGSVVYVRTCEPEEIEVRDVITYRMGTDTEHVMTHRVVEIDSAEQVFVTKGDANNTVDSEPVAFHRLIGKVTLSIPGLAAISDFINTTVGKAVLFIAFAFAFMLWLIADMLQPRKTKKQKIGEETEVKKTTNITKQQKIQITMRVVGIFLVLGALIYMGNIFAEYGKSNAEYDRLKEYVFAPESAPEASGQGTEEADNESGSKNETEAESVETVSDEQIMNAIAALQKENEDVVGWISFENLDLSYPVMHCGDNEYYLRRTFSGESNNAGSIFIEGANSPDFEDYHTIIYGHNMRDLSMFGQLKYYKKEDFYQDHQYFKIYTPEQVYRYHIFAYYDISEIGDVYTIGFQPTEEYQSFLNIMKMRSYYDTGVTVTKNDKVITLSTCSSDGNRFVVNAKRVEE